MRKSKTNNMRFLLYIIVAFPLLISPACKKKVETSLRPDAIELYHKSARLLRLYLDSFSLAKDSATLLDLDSRFNHSLTTLNFKFPAETCLEISEGENDTLTNLTERLVALKDSLLFLYAHPVTDEDSIPIDSLSMSDELKK
ncbi:MAG: hypothetical protein K2N05_04300 [Muribaculaceae bacterium]|nr:hypothetical protein [Muribaculaceae bacterium]